MTSKHAREGMRKGDDRPFDGQATPLRLLPARGEPFRWLPRHGRPYCIGEFIVQSLIRVFAFLPFYTAVIVTCIILIQVFGLPWGLGK